jgi:hypothetical protein
MPMFGIETTDNFNGAMQFSGEPGARAADAALIIARENPESAREWGILVGTTIGTGPFAASLSRAIIARIISRLAAKSVVGLPSKVAAREALSKLGLPEAQAQAAQSAIARATTSSTIDIIQKPGGTVVVRVVRSGADGFQAIESTITRNGTKTVIQKAWDSTGRLVHKDPKTP